MRWLTTLFAEQTTPEGVVTFLLLGTLITLVIAFVLYAIVITILWKWRMKGQGSWRALLLPSKAQLRKYASEYITGLMTAVLLTATIVVKHNVVETVLETDVTAIGSEQVRAALPEGSLSEEELIASGADQTSAREISSWVAGMVSESVRIQLDELVRPLLAAGMVENANLVTRAIVDKLGSSVTSPALQRALLIAAIALLLIYVIGLGLRRSREIEKDRGTGPSYAAITKRLALPAVCIPLLVASAVALEDTESIVRRSVETVGDYVEEDATPVEAAVRRQTEVAYEVSPVHASDLEDLIRGLRELQTRAAANSQRAANLETRLDIVESDLRANAASLDAANTCCARLDGTLNGMGDQIAEVRDRLGERVKEISELAMNAEVLGRSAMASTEKLQGSVDGLQRGLDELARQMKNQDGSQNGLLLVQNTLNDPAYYVRASSARAGRTPSGYSIGIHSLPAGTYVVSSATGQPSETVKIEAGRAATVRLRSNYVVR